MGKTHYIATEARKAHLAKYKYASRTHGHTATKTYHIWSAMKQRCLNGNSHNYKTYGARGIRVCERWLVFENFLADMGEKPDGKSLDRYPNNDGNYEPGNCRWATRIEQANNTQRSIRLEANGQTLSVREWSELTGICMPTLFARIRRGWAPERVIQK